MNEKKLLEALEGMIENRGTSRRIRMEMSPSATIQAVELEGVRQMIINPECLDMI